MIDLILFCFFLGAFYAGIYCGKTYGSLKETLVWAWAAIGGWFGTGGKP